MSHALRLLGKVALAGVAEGLRSGRLAPPYTRAALAFHAPPRHVDAVVAALNGMDADGMAPRHIASALALLAEERGAAQVMSDRIELVWSPPEHDRVDCRDTSVVIQDLFHRARESVLIVTYVFDQGAKAEALFSGLAGRMDAVADLRVRVIANVQREYGDSTPSAMLVHAFSQRLREKVWPGERLPEVYYYPRALAADVHEHAVLHAKCVVVDRRLTLLTSANLTDAGQHRNIEAGALIDDAGLAARITLQFDRLVESGMLQQLP